MKWSEWGYGYVVCNYNADISISLYVKNRLIVSIKGCGTRQKDILETCDVGGCITIPTQRRYVERAVYASWSAGSGNGAVSRDHVRYTGKMIINQAMLFN